ncbi:MAG TPA: PqqD family peptide modification chaperone [Gemmatimonadaceae bacterium]|nr:PqqD family peptide modification chaperone [Gemmatimonadaceae bacterium]
MSAEPKLRTDLIVSRMETPEGPRFVLKDPRTRRYFRLRELEYAIARRLDGRSPTAELAPALSAELDVDLDASALDAFVAQLRRQGLIDDPSAPTPPREGFVRGTPLYLRFRAFDPDRLLDWLIVRVRFFFTPYFVLGSAVLLGWAIITVVTHRADIMQDLTRLWNFQSLFLAWVVVLCVVTLHEFAHGLTCKNFGGRVHEMGFMLIYFQPAFYCNISDAWLFPQKSRRLWVTAAGAYFELFVWSVATLIWTVVEPGTWISGVALIVMATSAIKQFFNLNPLIKLDGYYFLSDLLEVPNLRQRAFSYLSGRLRRLVGAIEPSGLLDASGRERAIFVAYGAMAFTFSYWFLAKIVLGIGGYLTSRYQGPGFVAFTMFLGLVFPQPVRRLIGRRTSSRPTPPPSTAVSPQTDTTASAAPAPSASGVKLGSRKRRAVSLTLAAVVVALLFVARIPLRVGGAFELLPARNADVPSTIGGVIERVYVEEGSVVEAGDTIARLSGRDHRARLRAVEADVAEREAQLRLLKAGARPEELALARLAVARAEEPLRVAQAEVERVRTLAATQVVTRAELERAEEQVAVLTNELEQARGRLAMLTAGSRPEEIAATAQAVARAVAERNRLEAEIARLVVVAPHGGVVMTPRLWEKVGGYVEPGDLVAEIHSLDRLTAQIDVSERDIGEVQLGQPVALRLRAYPNRTFQGTVTRIAGAAADSGWLTERTVRVEVDLPNAGHLLRPMMTGYARIHVGDRRAVDVLTRRVRRYVRVEFWSWW